MRVLVCGGRTFFDKYVVEEVLSSLFDITEIVQGGATGADTLAKAWATSRGIPVLSFPADWQKYGLSAGPIRNKQMLDEGKPEIVIAFPGGLGTRNMIRQAKRAGLEVVEIVIVDGVWKVKRAGFF